MTILLCRDKQSKFQLVLKLLRNITPNQSICMTPKFVRLCYVLDLSEQTYVAIRLLRII